MTPVIPADQAPVPPPLSRSTYYRFYAIDRVTSQFNNKIHLHSLACLALIPAHNYFAGLMGKTTPDTDRCYLLSVMVAAGGGPNCREFYLMGIGGGGAQSSDRST